MLPNPPLASTQSICAWVTVPSDMKPSSQMVIVLNRDDIEKSGGRVSVWNFCAVKSTATSSDQLSPDVSNWSPDRVSIRRVRAMSPFLPPGYLRRGDGSSDRKSVV